MRNQNQEHFDAEIQKELVGPNLKSGKKTVSNGQKGMERDVTAQSRAYHSLLRYINNLGVTGFCSYQLEEGVIASLNMRLPKTISVNLSSRSCEKQYGDFLTRAFHFFHNSYCKICRLQDYGTSPDNNISDSRNHKSFSVDFGT